jgi:hypothetical protein
VDVMVIDSCRRNGRQDDARCERGGRTDRTLAFDNDVSRVCRPGLGVVDFPMPPVTGIWLLQSASMTGVAEVGLLSLG